MVTIIIPQGFHGSVRRIRERSQSARRCHRSVIPVRHRLLSLIVPSEIAGGQSPTIFSITYIPPLVLDTIPLIDLCHFLVVLEIIRVLIRELMWVQPEIGVMDKEKRTSIRDTYFQVLPIISIAIRIHLTIFYTSPIGTVFLRILLLAGPAAIIHLRRDSVFRPHDSQHIGNHGLIPADQFMIDHPRLIWRPVPI